MSLKVCKKCGLEKEAIKGIWVTTKGKPIGLLCLECKGKVSLEKYHSDEKHEAYKAASSLHCQKVRATTSGRLAANQASLKWAETHREQARCNSLKWAKNNAARCTKNSVARHASKLQRTPKWLTADDWFLIEEAYELAALRSKVTGIKHHVDHVVPLRGKLASGLHVPSNLQVIPSLVNIRKTNKWDPCKS